MTDNLLRSQEAVEEEARRWIVRMSSGEMTADELAAFKAWRLADHAHDRAFQEQRMVWRAAGSQLLPIQHTPRSSKGLRWHSGFSRKSRSISRSVATSGIAAILVAGLFGPDLLLIAQADHRTGTSIESLALPDGSRAVLNAGSAIAVSYDDDERRISLLRGDAWFEVKHGDTRPFRVAALGGISEDIGTAFEVQRRSETVTVAVTEGVVAVSVAQHEAGLMLRASQRARYDREGDLLRLSAAEPSSIAAWRQGEILLESASPDEAIAAIRPYHAGPVYILGTTPSQRRISGAFRTDRTDEALDAIARMAGLSVYRMGPIAIVRPSA